MKQRMKFPVVAVAAMFALSGCNLLDVDNPNNLTEEAVNLEAAANGVANGSLRLTADAISDVWQLTGVASDELFWTGSRDGWNTLDQGLVGDPGNEFTDAVFPQLGEAVWMSGYAVDVLERHVAESATPDAFVLDLHRAEFFRGIILMVTGETQDDMTFSDKMEDGPPVGAANMYTVLDDAIGFLDRAVDGFADLGDDERELQARAVRARAYMSRAIWDELNPSADGQAGAMNFAAAVPDAEAVLAGAGSADYRFGMVYSSSAGTCSMCSWVNNRGENQVNDDLIALTTSGTGASGRLTDSDSVDAVINDPGYSGGPVEAASGESVNVIYMDPVSGEPDPAVKTFVDRFGSNQYGALTVASARLMHLILAEHALATLGGGAGSEFETQINAIRDLDGKVAFASNNDADDLAMLQHERRINTLFMGLRLQDMYRWGLESGRWQGSATTMTAPGTMMPIATVEVRANCHLNGQGCEG